MYLIDWNATDRRIEASLGGAVTEAEASVFLEEVRAQMSAHHGSPFEFHLDMSRATDVDHGVEFALARILVDAPDAGATLVKVIARDAWDAQRWTSVRLQRVLEGFEAFEAAA